ncbi:MAG: HipA domain-containing protein [Acidiferrobacterales bacterium]
MSDSDTLNIWHEQRLVGRLWRNPVGVIGFRYDPEWIAGGGFAVSRSLPLTTRGKHSTVSAPEEGGAQRWFANLLPEGAVREHIVRDLKLPNTDFDLLRAIGGECAGALSILPVDQRPSGKRQYHALTEKDLADLAARRGKIYAAWPAGERPRLSLAGAQDKCPVLVRGDRYFLPQGEAPLSHILKFELPDYRHLPAYETFTTRLAASIGLPVVDIALRTIGQTRYARITRYDRLQNEYGEVQRLHQEDFCQALGYGHENKYQEHGGPSFEQCYRLVQESSSEPAIDAQHLLRWQIFNVLAGNSDGHAKNLSLLYLPDGVTRLAPFYDLACARAIERIDFHLAFDVGGERNPSVVTHAHWQTLAKAC